MSKFNLTELRRTSARSVIRSAAGPTALTYEGAPAWARDARSELFLLAVTDFVGEETFYEAASERDARFIELVRGSQSATPSGPPG